MEDQAWRLLSSPHTSDLTNRLNFYKCTFLTDQLKVERSFIWNLLQENVVNLFSNKSSQSQKLSINPVQHSFQEIAFPWVLAVEKFQKLKDQKFNIFNKSQNGQDLTKSSGQIITKPSFAHATIDDSPCHLLDIEE